MRRASCSSGERGPDGNSPTGTGEAGSESERAAAPSGVELPPLRRRRPAGAAETLARRSGEAVRARPDLLGVDSGGQVMVRWSGEAVRRWYIV